MSDTNTAAAENSAPTYGYDEGVIRGLVYKTSSGPVGELEMHSIDSERTLMIEKQGDKKITVEILRKGHTSETFSKSYKRAAWALKGTLAAIARTSVADFDDDVPARQLHDLPTSGAIPADNRKKDNSSSSAIADGGMVAVCTSPLNEVCAPGDNDNYARNDASSAVVSTKAVGSQYCSLWEKQVITYRLLTKIGSGADEVQLEIQSTEDGMFETKLSHQGIFKTKCFDTEHEAKLEGLCLARKLANFS